MKNKYVSAVLIAIYGLMVGFGPQTLFKVCVNSTTPMKCTYTAAAEIGVGLVALLIALLMICTRTYREGMLLSLAALGKTAFGLALPAFLIGGCKSSKMPCLMVTFPMIYAVSGILAAFLIVRILMLKGAREPKA